MKYLQIILWLRCVCAAGSSAAGEVLTPQYTGGKSDGRRHCNERKRRKKRSRKCWGKLIQFILHFRHITDSQIQNVSETLKPLCEITEKWKHCHPKWVSSGISFMHIFDQVKLSQGPFSYDVAAEMVRLVSTIPNQVFLCQSLTKH